MRQLGIIVFISLLASQVHAVGKINRYTSLSADYCRNVNRYAATGLDAAYYNPAGIINLSKVSFYSGTTRLYELRPWNGTWSRSFSRCA